MIFSIYLKNTRAIVDDSGLLLAELLRGDLNSMFLPGFWVR